MKRKVIIIGALVIALAGAWVVSKNAFRQTQRVPTKDGTSKNETNENKGGKRPVKGQRPPTPEGIGGNPTNGVEKVRPDWDDIDWVDDKKVTETERQQIKKMQAALDKNDLDGVREAARQLMKSESVAARVRTATALGWFGATALPELVEMLGDTNAEVVEAALSPTLDAILEMDDGPEKAQLLAALVATLNDLDALDEALMLFTSIDDEIVIPLLEKLIRETQGNPAKQAALIEHLKFTTGEVLE